MYEAVGPLQRGGLMKSYWIVNRDNQTSIERRDIPVPQPRGGEFLIKVHASALNRGELLAGGVMHGGPEKIVGNEVSGTVEALGDGVSGIKVGDRVLGRARGGFAEFAIREAAPYGSRGNRPRQRRSAHHRVRNGGHVRQA
jgi:NADPH:quinone reductase